MTQWIFILLAMAGSAVFSAESSALPVHYVFKNNVFYIGQPKVTARVLIFDESKEKYAYLTIAATDPESFSDQQSAVQAAYPEKNVERVLSRGLDEATVSVAALGLAKNTTWIPYQNGPGVNLSFTLSKTQTQQLLQSVDMGVRIGGKIQFSLTEERVVESIKRGPEFCRRIFSEGHRFEDVILGFSRLAQEVNSLPVRYPETRQNLKKSAMRNCIEIPEGTRVESFAELLDSTVLEGRGQSIEGSTSRSVLTQKSGNFTAETPKTPTSVINGG